MSQTPAQAAACQRYKERHIATGLCVKCPNHALPGSQLCGLCYSKNKQSKQRIYKQRSKEVIERIRRNKKRYRDEGRCTSCGRPLDEEADRGRLTCVGCIWRRGMNR